MVVIQLSDAQVAEIANDTNIKRRRLDAFAAGGNWTGDKSVRSRSSGRREPTVGDLLKGGDRTTVGDALAKRDSLLLTVLADLRALQVAARTAGRREVESRVVAIIDGIENTVAES